MIAAALAWAKGLFAGLWGYLAAAIGAVAAVVVVYQKGKSAGESEVAVESAKKELENVQVAKEVERDVALTPADKRRKRLRKFQRD